MTAALTDQDKVLVEAAHDQIKRAYEPIWHTVGAAVRTKNGKIYTGVNVDASTGSGGGACAEMSALSAAISAGDKHVVAVVAVAQDGRILPPCGVCRQTLITHAPESEVIVQNDSKQLLKVTIRDLLPYAYENSRNS